MDAIRPVGPTVTLSCSTTTANTAMAPVTEYMWLVVDGTVPVFVVVAGSGGAATVATGVCVPAASGLLIRRTPKTGTESTHLHAITESGTAKLFATPVEIR